MSNQWFRMYAEFASDAKVQMMPEAYQRRLMMLMCLRCNGDVTLQDCEVAFQLRISNEEWAVTKAEFVAKGFIDSSNELLNWDKRQYRSDSSAERVRKHREAKRNGDVTECNVTVTPPEQIQNRTDTEKKVRGTRFTLQTLPDDWRQFCKMERPDLNPDKTFEKFADYWRADNTPKAVKRDWLAAWRNWVRAQWSSGKKAVVAETGFGRAAL